MAQKLCRTVAPPAGGALDRDEVCRAIVVLEQALD
jgi:hypothetical protein